MHLSGRLPAKAKPPAVRSLRLIHCQNASLGECGVHHIPLNRQCAAQFNIVFLLLLGIWTLAQGLCREQAPAAQSDHPTPGLNGPHGARRTAKCKHILPALSRRLSADSLLEQRVLEAHGLEGARPWASSHGTRVFQHRTSGRYESDALPGGFKQNVDAACVRL